jgi:outer membrane lipoprotein SlyB
MNSIRIVSLASLVSLTAALAACGSTDPYGPNNYPVSQPGTYPSSSSYPHNSSYPSQPVAAVEYGQVTSVSVVEPGNSTTAANRSVAGGVVGAIVGGLLGNQIGGGSGKSAATVIGATAGAVLGSNVGRNTTPPAYNTAGPVYRVTIQTDSGAVRTYDVSATGDLRPGDRVRIENGMIYLA